MVILGSYYITTLTVFDALHENIQGPHKVKVGASNVVTAKDIIIATGSVPFVPKGIEVDGK